MYFKIDADALQEYERQVGIEYYVSETPGINGLLKLHPDDFKVVELSSRSVEVSPQILSNAETGGLYTWFVLEKRGIDTLTAISRLASHFKKPLRDFSVSGLKDAWAHTIQLVSVWNLPPEKISSYSDENIKIYSPVRRKYPLHIGSHWGNAFVIRVREVDAGGKSLDEAFLSRIKTITEDLDRFGGVLNYFGLQRFGATRPIGHKIGRYLLEGRYEEATLEYLTYTTPHEPEHIRNLRLSFKETLNYELLKKFPFSYVIERKLGRFLVKHPAAYGRAWKNFDRNLRRLFVSAFQSYLFNRMLSFLFETHRRGEVSINSETVLPILGAETTFEDLSPSIVEVVKKVLFQEKVSLSLFSQAPKEFRVKGGYRFALLKIHDLNVVLEKHEDLDKNKKNLVFSFKIRKGGYATIVMREFQCTRKKS